MQQYHYGIGRIRALETKLLSGEQLIRMAKAADFACAFSVLSNSSYAENLKLLSKPFDFFELCRLESAALKKLLIFLAPQESLILSLFEKYDFLNAKILLKLKLIQPDHDAQLSELGSIKTEKLTKFVLEGLRIIDHKLLIQTCERAEQIYKETKKWESIEYLLENSYYRQFKAAAESSGSPLIKALANSWIDLLNIKLVLLGFPPLDSGRIDKSIFIALKNKNPQEISSRLSFSPYFPALSSGIEYFTTYRSLFLLEKLMDDFIVTQFRLAKYKASGLEPLVGYYLAKDREIKTIRFILICKKNHAEADRIQERIRLVY